MSSPSTEHQSNEIIMASSVSTNIEDMYSSMDIVNEASSKTNDKSGNLPPQLISKLVGDVIVGCGVTFSIAPFISIIDKSIVQRAAGTHTIVQSCMESTSNIVRNPVSFMKSPMFLMMWGVYAATYTTANCLKTIVEHTEETNRLHNDSFTCNNNRNVPSFSFGSFGVFTVTTLVNSATSMMKDKFYATKFSATTSKIPYKTFYLWGLRDCIVIGSSFILPEFVSKSLQEQTGVDKTTALQISQIACPVLSQFVATPIQMLGLDVYNRPLSNHSYKSAIRERFRFQYFNFSSILTVRIARIAPSYGIGGVGNTYFRDMWRRYINEMYLDDHSIRLRLQQ